MTNDTKARRTIIYAGDPRAPAEVWLEWSALPDGSEVNLEDDFTEKPDFRFMPVRYVSEAAQGALIERIEDAMQSVDQEQAGDGVMWGDMAQLSYAISNLDPDATAALEALRWEAVEQERERCAAAVRAHWMPGDLNAVGDAVVSAILSAVDTDEADDE